MQFYNSAYLRVRVIPGPVLMPEHFSHMHAGLKWGFTRVVESAPSLSTVSRAGATQSLAAYVQPVTLLLE